jgi:hypothetical protein
MRDLLEQQLFQKADLLLLNRQQCSPLVFPQAVDLLVQQHDFQFGFQVDFVVMFRDEPVFLGLPVL